VNIDNIVCGDNIETMRTMPDKCIDLTVTSPPYDNLRTYNGFTFNFIEIAKELYRITKDGGIVVWVVGDATFKGSETGTSFKQALYFKEIGFNLHDTMIYQKANSGMAGSLKCYIQAFEYMFVFSKGIPKTINIIRDRENLRAGKINKNPARLGVDGNMKKQREVIAEKYGRRLNIWKYGHDGSKTGHPAVFPEKLANDHILTWSNQGDLIFDPFCGSGTTCKMAKINNRHYKGIDISQEYCDISNSRVAL